MKKPIVKLLTLFFMLLLVLGGRAQASQAQTNLLQNASFEFPYQNNGEASSWGRWHRNSSEDQFKDCTNGYHKRPTWSAETNGALVQSGSVSQHIGNQWDTWSAGVFQTVNVNPGSTYRFSVWSYAFGSNNDFPGPVEAGLNANIQVGIDPNGSGLWNDSDVVWSGTINPQGGWQQASVQVTATGNQVSVFTRADWGVKGVNQCRKHLDVWFDSAELVEVGPPPTNTPVPQPTSPPPPPATNTPVLPTPTLTPEVPPTETPVPATETPIPPTGGTICVNAFADTNANGQKDADEGYMGNVTFTVGQGANVVGQAVSTGTSNPVCFEGLAAGSYQIAQTIPGRLEMTTASNTTIPVESGQTVGVEFGSRIRTEDTAVDNSGGEEVASVDTGGSQPTATPADSAATEDGGFNLLALSGIALIVVAVLILGGILFLVLNRRSS